MDYEYLLPIGDWSEDGHGKCQDVKVKTNKPKQEIQQAYSQFEKDTHLTFDSNPQMRGLERSTTTSILNAYEDNKLTKGVIERLEQAGVDMTYMKDHITPYAGGLLFGEAQEVASLFMACVKSVLPDFEYEVIEDDAEYLFGYWDRNLNISVGYGIFY